MYVNSLVLYYEPHRIEQFSDMCQGYSIGDFVTISKRYVKNLGTYDLGHQASEMHGGRKFAAAADPRRFV